MVTRRGEVGATNVPSRRHMTDLVNVASVDRPKDPARPYSAGKTYMSVSHTFARKSSCSDRLCHHRMQGAGQQVTALTRHRLLHGPRPLTFASNCTKSVDFPNMIGAVFCN